MTNPGEHILILNKGCFPQAQNNIGHPNGMDPAQPRVQKAVRKSGSLSGGRLGSHPLRVVITGGGTGGHLFPGIAIAEAFIEKRRNTKLLFVSIGNRFEQSVLSRAGFDLKGITAEGIKGRSLFMKLRSAVKIPKGIFDAIRILKSFRPDIVVGMGGYSSGPVGVAAWLLRIKVVLHEQNLQPGITNRLLSILADRIYVSFQHTLIGRNPSKIKNTGNPVRRSLLVSVGRQNETKAGKRSGNGKFTVLVLGGSQGAHSINMAVVDALALLEDKKRYFFIHQTGSEDESLVKDRYKKIGVKGRVKSFFHDMAAQYMAADLIICRAGATTVAEVTAAGRGAIFIPYPFAADNHQALNAQALVDCGAAEVIFEQSLSGEILAGRIESLAENPGELNEKAKKSKALGKPEAADVIVSDCLMLLELE